MSATCPNVFTVPMSQCDAGTKPSTSMLCGTPMCGAKWHTSPWGACSSSGGIDTCAALPEVSCAGAGAMLGCKWEGGKCTKGAGSKCGSTGTQTRTVDCKTASGAAVNASKCDTVTKPSATMSCYTPTCGMVKAPAKPTACVGMYSSES